MSSLTPPPTLKREPSSDSELPPAKRQRTSFSPAVVEEFTRSKHLWFEDGSLFVQAGDVRCWVHRSMLCMYSPVLKQSISRLPPHEDVLRLDDDWSSVHHMLCALYGLGTYFDRRKPMHVPVLDALLQMGRKYRIPALRQEAEQRLTLSFPATLREFDRAVALRPPLIAPYTGYCMDLINVAHAGGVRSALPVLYYLASKSLPTLLGTGARPDGSRVRLGSEMLGEVLLGRDAFLRWQATVCFRWMHETEYDVPGCRNAAACTAGRREVAKRMAGMLPSVLIGLAPWRDPPVPLCAECRRRASGLYEMDRRRTWERLPNLFGLSSWEELKRGD